MNKAEIDRQVKEAFMLVAELGCLLDAAPLSKFPDCWECDIDERWHIAVNGHSVSKKTSDGFDLNPFRCAIKFNGWPAGIITPIGGTMAAGEAANEDTFIAALQARIAKERAAQGGGRDV